MMIKNIFTMLAGVLASTWHRVPAAALESNTFAVRTNGPVGKAGKGTAAYRRKARKARNVRRHRNNCRG